MKPYSNTNCSMSYQPISNDNLMIILRGDEDSIEAIFRACYNFGATKDFRRKSKTDKESAFDDFINSQREYLTYTTHLRDTAYFYSSESKIKRFWFNKFYHANIENWPKKKHGIKNDSGIFPACDSFASRMTKEFIENSREVFYNPAKETKVFDYLYGLGDRIEASRPDLDFRDSVVLAGFQPKDKFIERDIEEIIED